MSDIDPRLATAVVSIGYLALAARESAPTVTRAVRLKTAIRYELLMRFANSLTIQRPLQDVVNYLAAFENAPQWNYAIAETRKASDGPVRVGTIYGQTRSLPSRSEETFQVTEFDPNRRLAIRGDLGPLKGTLTYEWSP
jgi:hypothetical protein